MSPRPKEKLGTKKMTVTYGFVIWSMCYGTSRMHNHDVDAEWLVVRASTMTDLFPSGLTLEQAQYMLEHRAEVIKQ